MNKLKVLLLYSSMVKNNNADASLRVAPIGLFYINGFLKKKSYETKIVHVSRSYFSEISQNAEEYIRSLKKQIQDFNPDYIGFSFRNLYNNGIIPDDPGQLVNFLTVSFEKKVIDFLRSISRVKIIGGGSAFSIAPRLYLKYLNLDYGIVGEGEKALEKLLSCLHGKKDVRAIPGLVYKDKENIIINKPEIIEDLKCVPEMNVDDFENFREFCYENGGYANIQTKRGCSFKCIYCLYPFLEGTKYRLRNINSVINEISTIQRKYKINHFYFVDSVFSYPSQHSYDLCMELIKRKMVIRWSAYINPLQINRKLLEVYKQSGCQNLVCTFDAIDPVILKKYGKNFTLNDIKKCIDLLNDIDIPFEVSMIIGGPDEYEKTVNATMSFCNEYLKDVPIVFYAGMWCHPKTPSREVIKEVHKLSESQLPEFDEIILSNDFKTHNLLHYFFTDIKEENERRKIIYRTLKKVRCYKRIISGMDFVYDKSRCNLKYADKLGVIENQRPWYLGMKGRLNN